eukprot:2532820-Prymnesium_polylepis.1
MARRGSRGSLQARAVCSEATRLVAEEGFALLPRCEEEALLEEYESVTVVRSDRAGGHEAAAGRAPHGADVVHLLAYQVLTHPLA